MPPSGHRGGTAPHQAVRGTTMLVGPVHQEEVWTRFSQRKPARSNIHTSTTALRNSGHSLNRRYGTARSVLLSTADIPRPTCDVRFVRQKLSVEECPDWVCAVQRRRFPVGANPIRQPLQPEAIGAVMEVTKWLKPSISVSQIGGSQGFCCPDSGADRRCA